MACGRGRVYGSSKSAVLLEGEKSDTFTVEQDVAQGCSLSPILFSVFVDDLLRGWNKLDLGYSWVVAERRSGVC